MSFKKVNLILGGLFLTTSAFAAKKAVEIKGIIYELQYRVIKLKKLDLSQLFKKGEIRIIVDVAIENPTKETLNIPLLKIKGLEFYLKDNKDTPFAVSKMNVENIVIPSDSKIDINDISTVISTKQTKAIYSIIQEYGMNEFINHIDILPILELNNTEIKISR